LSCSGRPEGLSFLRIRVPAGVAGVVKSSVTLKGTKFTVIHSPWAWAGLTARVSPLASIRMTGKEASKYQVPRASPEMLSGLVTRAFGWGLTDADEVGLGGRRE